METQIPGFDLFVKVQAINLHFSTKVDYDYIKYKGRINRTVESFENNRKSKWQYIALENKINSKLIDMDDFLFLMARKTKYKYILHPTYSFFKSGNAMAESFPQHMDEFVTSVQEDLKYIRDHVEYPFEIDNNYPVLYNEYKAGNVGVESLILMDRYVQKFMIPESSPDKILWPKELKRFEKIAPFVLKLIDSGSFNFVMQEHGVPTSV